MIGVLSGFATIAVVIALGALVAQLGVIDWDGHLLLNRIAFFVASPALLATTIARTDVGQILSRNLLATAIGALVPFLLYAVIARHAWRRGPGDLVVGSLASGYVNAGNLGIPVAAYALGNASFVAPTLLLQLLLFQPGALALLDADRSGRRPRVRDFIVRPLTNPLTVGTAVGLALSATGWVPPPILWRPVELVAAMAVPGMLLAYGIALRLGPGLGGDIPRAELALTTGLKLVAQPLVAWAFAHLVLGVDGHALLAIVVCSALPTAQNIYVHASRYGRATTLARDTILLTTIGSVPVTLLVTVLLGR